MRRQLVCTVRIFSKNRTPGIVHCFLTNILRSNSHIFLCEKVIALFAEVHIVVLLIIIIFTDKHYLVAIPELKMKT